MRCRELLLLLAAGCAPGAVSPADPAHLGAPLDVPVPRAPSVAPPSAVTPAPGSVSAPAAPGAAPAPTPAPGAAPAPAAKAASAPPGARDALMDRLLGGGSAALKTVVATPVKYRFQVLYGVITTGAVPTLERHAYRPDAEYFFPASSMKVPIALATYDRIAALQQAGKPWLTRDAALKIYPVTGAGEPFSTTIARETWRALIASDNASANRLLGFVGHREVHEDLWALGLASARIHSGFATGAEIDPAELSPRIDVGVANGATEELPARRSDLVLPKTDATSLDIGVANIVDGRRVPGPLSFADKNAMRLRDLQDTLVRIMRPELLQGGVAAAVGPEDLTYLRLALGTLPSESGLAGFERNVVADYTLSPFLRGIERVLPRGHFQIFSKVGQAYGFLNANAYVVDKDSGRAFFLAATVYANPDETMNNDKYAYDEISFPALADVGEAFCRHAFAP